MYAHDCFIRVYNIGHVHVFDGPLYTMTLTHALTGEGCDGIQH